MISSSSFVKSMLPRISEFSPKPTFRKIDDDPMTLSHCFVEIDRTLLLADNVANLRIGNER
jgi:hypothetical protein